MTSTWILLLAPKLVRNVTAGGGFAATGTGDPGDILEYQVTISNSGSTAEAVVVTDPVPAYTTLVTHNAAYGDGLGGNIFAQVTEGTPTSVALTLSNADDESAAIASGDATGTVAGSTISIYVGRDQIPTNTGPTVGGDVRDSVAFPADVFVILYQVQIDN